MAIGSVDTLPASAASPPLTPTPSQKKSAYVPPDLSENGLARTQLTDYQADSDKQDGGEDELSFWDVLDVINPLQHIPIVNTVYRELTGDKIGSGAKLIGGGLFFGPIGLGFAALDVGVKEMTGASIDEHVVAMVKGEDAGENARIAAAAESTQKAEKFAKAEVSAVTPDAGQAAQASVQAAPVGAVDRPNAPLGLFSAATVTPAQTAQAATPGAAPLGLIGGTAAVPVSTQTTANQIAQNAAASTRSLESTRPRGRLARSPQVSQDHLAMAMQAQGLEASKLMTVPSRSATAVSAQMIAAEKQAQVNAQTQMQTASAPPAGRTALPTQLMPASAPPATDKMAAAPVADPTTPVDVPAWFDSAMMKASAAYQKTNQVTTAP